MLDCTPPDFVPHGGMALALRLGHRLSFDFGFFSRSPFIPDELKRRVACLTYGRVTQKAGNTLTYALDLDREVKISFSGLLNSVACRIRIGPKAQAFLWPPCSTLSPIIPMMIEQVGTAGQSSSSMRLSMTSRKVGS